MSRAGSSTRGQGRDSGISLARMRKYHFADGYVVTWNNACNRGTEARNRFIVMRRVGFMHQNCHLAARRGVLGIGDWVDAPTTMFSL